MLGKKRTINKGIPTCREMTQTMNTLLQLFLEERKAFLFLQILIFLTRKVCY